MQFFNYNYDISFYFTFKKTCKYTCSIELLN